MAHQTHEKGMDVLPARHNETGSSHTQDTFGCQMVRQLHEVPASRRFSRVSGGPAEATSTVAGHSIVYSLQEVAHDQERLAGDGRFYNKHPH